MGLGLRLRLRLRLGLGLGLGLRLRLRLRVRRIPSAGARTPSSACGARHAAAQGKVRGRGGEGVGVRGR